MFYKDIEKIAFVNSGTISFQKRCIRFFIAIWGAKRKKNRINIEDNEILCFWSARVFMGFSNYFHLLFLPFITKTLFIKLKNTYSCRTRPALFNHAKKTCCSSFELPASYILNNLSFFSFN
jgi:hypothetical protein